MQVARLVPRVAVLTIVLLPAWTGVAGTGSAAVVTKRLGTGLPPSPTTGRLPEAWVAPAREAPAIDGKLDDEVWSATRPIVLGKLESYGETSPRTEARLVHKDRVLYVGVRLAEPNVAGMKRTVVKPDGPAYGDDSVELFLSPPPSRGYFQMIVSATGAIYDRHGHGNPAHWNSAAKAATVVGKDGWSLELAVPMSALGVGDEMPKRWRANLYRNRRAGPQSQSQAFSPTFRGDYDVPERFGHLLFTPTSPWAELDQAAGEQLGVSVEELGDRTTVLLFDLSIVPKGAKVYRARLRCEREPMDGLHEDVLRAIEIYPLAGPYKKGSRPQTAGKPLELLGPWYDAFEMTELVRGWLSGRPGAGVWVKRFPGWRKDRTFLDVMFEGKPGQVPPAASTVKAFHRSGQTFITWKEIEDPIGRERITWGELKSILNDLDRRRQIRYCIYRSTRPITAETLPQAELIAEVSPLSCWNLNGRNIGRPIDRFIATAKVLNWHQWNPFQNARIDGDYGRDCPIDRFVIAEGRPPLASGTGLYVYTAVRNDRGD